MSAPTPISSLVHSSTLVTAGILLIRKFPTIIPNTLKTSIFIIIILSLCLSRCIGIFTKDFKKIVAYSTLSQISIILLCICINLKSLSMFHLYTHAFFKRLLFFSVGNIIHNNNNSQEYRSYSNCFKSRNFNCIVIIISLLSISSLIFISGFYRKECIIENFLNKNISFFIPLVYFIFSLTIIYCIKIFIVFYKI